MKFEYKKESLKKEARPVDTPSVTSVETKRPARSLETYAHEEFLIMTRTGEGQ